MSGCSSRGTSGPRPLADYMAPPCEMYINQVAKDVRRIEIKYGRVYRTGDPNQLYVNGNILGAGSCGQVEEGMVVYGPGHSSEAAVKIEPLSELRQRLQMLKEFEVLAALNGKENIIQLLAMRLDNEDGAWKALLALEKAAYDLDMALRGCQLNPMEALRAARDVLQGILQMKEAGFLHRDIKPDNVLFLASPGVWVLSDFDQSVLLGSEEADSTIAGTRFYHAPENIQKDPNTLQSDMFTYGTVVLQLCVLQAADPWNAIGEAIEAAQGGRLTAEQLAGLQWPEGDPDVPSSTYPEHIKDALIAFLRGLLAYDPQRRPEPEEALEVLSGIIELFEEHMGVPPSPRSSSGPLSVPAPFGYPGAATGCVAHVTLSPMTSPRGHPGSTPAHSPRGPGLTHGVVAKGDYGDKEVGEVGRKAVEEVGDKEAGEVGAKLGGDDDGDMSDGGVGMEGGGDGQDPSEAVGKEGVEVEERKEEEQVPAVASGPEVQGAQRKKKSLGKRVGKWIAKLFKSGKGRETTAAAPGCVPQAATRAAVRAVEDAAPRRAGGLFGACFGRA